MVDMPSNQTKPNVTKRIEIKLDGKYKRMVFAFLNPERNPQNSSYTATSLPSPKPLK